jgi:CBS-domain-containing membrane protein
MNQPVETLMTTDPHTLRLDQPVRDVIDLMQTGRYRNVPIVDDEGALVGVVRPQDVLKFIAESFPEELLNLPPRPHQRMKATEGA